MVRSERKVLDRMAIGVARGEVHSAEIASLAQNLVDQADLLKKLLPVKRGSQSHAGDDVAHGDAHGRLQLVFGAYNLVGAGALCRQTVIEPDQYRTDLGIQIAQALDQLNGERPVEWFFFELP